MQGPSISLEVWGIKHQIGSSGSATGLDRAALSVPSADALGPFINIILNSNWILAMAGAREAGHT
jgi:hypothetical protein